MFVVQLKAGKQAVRIRRVKEPLLLTLCTSMAAKAEEAEIDSSDGDTEEEEAVGKPNVTAPDLGARMRLDTELYEGIVSQTIIEPTVRRSAVIGGEII